MPATDFSRLGHFRPAIYHHLNLSKEDTMATQIVFDHTGDSRHQFDPADAAAVAAAEDASKC
jgi:hypothetical protein